MTVRQVYVPSYRFKQLNESALKNGHEERKRVEMEKDEITSCVDAFDSVNNTDDAIFLCIRKALPDGDFRYGIICTALDSKILKINLSNFNLQTSIISNNKDSEIGAVIERVLKNMTFASKGN